MKRILVLCLALTLIFSALPMAAVTTSAAASDDATEAIIFEDFSRRKVGDRFDDDEIICAEKEGSATCVNTLGALGAVNAVKFDYDSLRGYHNIAGDQGFKIVYDEPKSLKDVTHLIYYFRMPISRVADEYGNNWGKSGVAIMMWLGDYEYAQLKDKSKIQLLSKDGSEWKTVETYQMYADIPSGFEGYIKIDLDDYNNDKVKQLSLHHTILQFSNLGAQCGPGYCNAVYGVTKNSDSIKVKLNGEKEARYYTTGATENDLKANKKLIDAAMHAEVLHTFSTHPIGYRLDENGLMRYQNKRDITTKLVPNVSGLLGYPALEISSPILGGFHDSNPMYELKYPAYQYTEGMEAIMFHVKCAGVHPAQPTRSTFRFNIYTEKNGQPTWTLLGQSQARYLSMGDTKWRLADCDDQGILTLPPNFEGFIMADIADMLTNPIIDDMEDRMMISSTLQFQATGGDAGNTYVQGIYKITNKNDKLETLVTFNNCDVYSLLDGKLADDNDLVIEGPRVGEIFEEVPKATSTNKPKLVSKTANSFEVEYPEMKGAAKYRIEVYGNKENAEGEIVYYCENSFTTKGKETKATVDGLKGATRYYIVVNALNSYGEAFRIYDFLRETTMSDEEYEASINIGKFGEDGFGATVHKLVSDYTLPVVIGGAIAAAVVIIGAVVLLIIFRKRKGAAK